MTAGAGSTEQSTRKHRPGRIIERPRLIKLLDDADAPVILIVAPAGYGKTTLARQWARTLSGVIWVSCTPAHRDVVTFAEDVAAGIDALGGNASRFVGEYMRARSNPQRAARDIALELAKKLDDSPAQWIIIDDHHHLGESSAIEEVVATLRGRSRARIVIATRVRPRWIAARHVLYGEVAELTRSDLALSQDEVTAVLGLRPELESLVRKANGWPAVVALAAGLSEIGPNEPVSSRLHRYVADELYRTAPASLQQHLIDLSLLPALTASSLELRFGSEAIAVLEAATELGFVSSEELPELHPLLREFLFTKVSEGGDLTPVRVAVESAIAEKQWGFALELVLRFALDDLVDPVLQHAYRPLISSGRLATLDAFGRSVRAASGFPPAAVEVIDAEVALRDGHFALAAAIAQRAHERLSVGHALRCRTSLVAGRAHLLGASFHEAIESYGAADREASDDTDRMESSFGLASVQVFCEQGDPSAALVKLHRLRRSSPTNLLRHGTIDLTMRRLTGYAGDVPAREAVDALASSEDPHARTAFAYTSSYILGVRGEYRRAERHLKVLAEDIGNFDLDFARPFLDWTQAFIDLGLRRFGEVDRHLQRVEDAGDGSHHAIHEINARMLRARLMLQTGEAGAAEDLLRRPPETTVFPSWLGEQAATRALAIAAQGATQRALAEADKATSMSRFAEVHVLALAARAVATTNRARGTESSRELFHEAERLFIWDPVICAIRASRDFAAQVADDHTLRQALKRLLQRAGDGAVARQVGLQVRNTATPAAVLSPRELEVLGLMARGMRNKEIALALFVAESTVKVHVRHILEKLGVHSRSAAVARFERTLND